MNFFYKGEATGTVPVRMPVMPTTSVRNQGPQRAAASSEQKNFMQTPQAGVAG